MAQLITLEDIRGFAPGAKLRVAKGTLFTPSATDYAHEKRLVIEYEAAEAATGCPEDSPELRREVIESCRWLLEKNLTIGTWGNISVRLNDGNILITPSKVGYDVMRPEDLVVLAPDGRIVDGFRLPTSERFTSTLLLEERILAIFPRDQAPAGALGGASPGAVHPPAGSPGRGGPTTPPISSGSPRACSTRAISPSMWPSSPSPRRTSAATAPTA